jgi:hypothetical protein
MFWGSRVLIKKLIVLHRGSSLPPWLTWPLAHTHPLPLQLQPGRGWHRLGTLQGLAALAGARPGRQLLCSAGGRQRQSRPPRCSSNDLSTGRDFH